MAPTFGDNRGAIGLQQDFHIYIFAVIRKY